MNLRRTERGFTIIEVVLVLAIAGLIFLIVFLALPQLQESRRDTQRRDDVGKLLAAVTTFSSNNGGNLPANLQVTGFADYLPPNFSDPTSGSPYEMPATEQTGTMTGGGKDGGGATPGTIFYSRNATCSGEGSAAGGGSKNAAIVMKLETGSYCQDTQ